MDEPLSSRHKLDRPGLSHVLGSSGVAWGVPSSGRTPIPWTRRATPSGWPAVRAARHSLRSAGAAIGARCTAARAAPCRRARRASGGPVAAIARASKAASIIVTGNASGEDAGASRPPAWGITLPRPAPHPAQSSPHPRRPDTMPPHPHPLRSSLPAHSTAAAVGRQRPPSRSTAAAPAPDCSPVRCLDEGEAVPR